MNEKNDIENLNAYIQSKIDEEVGPYFASLRGRKRTAYHEAGHAVAAILFKDSLKWVTIKRTKQTRGCTISGSTKLVCWQKRKDWPKRYRARLEQMAMVSVAGLVSERMFTDHVRSKASTHDIEVAVNFLYPFSPGHRAEAVTYVNWLMLRTHRLLLPHRLTIHRVAEALLTRRTLRRRDVLALFGR